MLQMVNDKVVTGMECEHVVCDILSIYLFIFIFNVLWSSGVLLSL